MSEEERRGPVKPNRRGLLASKIADRREQQGVVQTRFAKSVCLECGRKIDRMFCAACIAPFPKFENIGGPASGWQYRLVLKVFDYMGEITVERVDAFPPERGNRREIIAFCGTREEAQKIIERRKARTQ